MKIKLTLRGRTREDIDLLVTTDATATVGDVAAVLAAAGPEGAAPAIDPESVTLRILDPIGGRVVSVLPSTAFVTSLPPMARSPRAESRVNSESSRAPTRGCEFPCPSAVRLLGVLHPARSP